MIYTIININYLLLYCRKTFTRLPYFSRVFFGIVLQFSLLGGPRGLQLTWLIEFCSLANKIHSILWSVTSILGWRMFTLTYPAPTSIPKWRDHSGVFSKLIAPTLQTLFGIINSRSYDSLLEWYVKHSLALQQILLSFNLFVVSKIISSLKCIYFGSYFKVTRIVCELMPTFSHIRHLAPLYCG